VGTLVEGTEDRLVLGADEGVKDGALDEAVVGLSVTEQYSQVALQTSFTPL